MKGTYTIQSEHADSYKERGRERESGTCDVKRIDKLETQTLLRTQRRSNEAFQRGKTAALPLTAGNCHTKNPKRTLISTRNSNRGSRVKQKCKGRCPTDKTKNETVPHSRHPNPPQKKPSTTTTKRIQELKTHGPYTTAVSPFAVRAVNACRPLTGKIRN